MRASRILIEQGLEPVNDAMGGNLNGLLSKETLLGGFRWLFLALLHNGDSREFYHLWAMSQMH